MSSSSLIAILIVTASNLTSPPKHLLFHYPPHPSHTAPDDEELSDDDSSSISSSDSSSESYSAPSIPSSKYSRLTNERYTIEDDEEHQNEFDRDEEDREPWRRKPAFLTEWEQPLFDLQKQDLADILIPKDSLCNRKFELGIEDLVFLGHPVLIANTNTENGLGTSPSSSINDDTDAEVIIDSIKLTKFNVVFVMNPSWRGDYHDTVLKMYNEVCKKFTEACIMQHQEKGYLSIEAAKIHRTIRDAEEKGIKFFYNWSIELTNRSPNVHGMGTTHRYQ
jgi:Nitrogen Permease regulator of amino acid transport activity 3